MKYTLGLDVGTNSLGWAILGLNESNEPVKIENLGSRIFSDGRNPKDQTTLASKRRQKRHERRRRDRLIQRKKTILNRMIKMGLFPKSSDEQLDLKDLNVLTLRAKAVNEKLSAHEVGRVIYHLNLRRGFKSNRKSISEEDAKTKISERIQNLRSQMQEKNFKTVGEYLYDLYKKGIPTKATIETGFHLVRQLIEDEYDQIVATQKKHHKSISDNDWQILKDKIFFQRPLKPVETGKCSLFKEENRTFKYMPSFEDYRFLTELYNLSYHDAYFNSLRLSNEQIFSTFNEYKNKKEVSYSRLRKFLKLAGVEFSIERTKEKIRISTSNNLFSREDLFGEAWDKLSLNLKDRIASIYFENEDMQLIREQLAQLKVEKEILDNLPESLPSGLNESTAPFSAKALQRIVELIHEEKRHPSLILDDLLKNERPDYQQHDHLPYYGSVLPESMQPIPEHIKRTTTNINPDERQYGRIANPTVHAALRQIQAVVNDLITRYGKPENIHIEFARELKKSKKERDQDQKNIKKNTERNESARKFIENHNQKVTAFNLERAKMWFELNSLNNQVCAYSGQPISANMVLTEQVQVDHILPFSRTLDDSLSNKVLVLASENMKKGNKTPFEAFGKDEKKWATIQEIAKRLPFNKQWRFAKDAIKRFEEKESFLQRHLNDTRYISVIAKKYLATITDPNKIVTSKGQMTSIIRGRLGLGKLIQNPDGSKNRDDHRHHAVDALTIALTSRSYLKQISNASARKTDANKIPIHQPWSGFFAEAQEKFEKIIVSHKIDHGKNGPFMEETCFGLVKNPNEYEIENDFKLVTTKKITDIKDESVIRSKSIQEIAAKDGLEQLKEHNIKKLRIYDVSKEKHDEIGTLESGLAKVTHGRNSEHTKYYQKGDINYLAIWKLPQDITLKQDNHKKRKSDYIFTAIKTFDLNARNLNELKPHPAAKLVTKVYKGDTVILEVEGKENLYILKSIRAANKQIYFLKNNLSKEPEGAKQFLLAYSRLKDYRFRKIFTSPSGKIIDNGPILK